MAFWLFKQEPSEYSFDDLDRDGETVWTGVTNPLAQKHLRSVGTGDKVFFYHTGEEKAVVGVMRIIGDPTPCPDNPKHVVVTVGPIKKYRTPITLQTIKSDAAFAEWDLVKNSRLSVMPVTTEIWKKIDKMGS
ncbi:MAG: EVE domain-containing protein [Gemmataceae bacterium]